ncbi:MAG TPA: channel protein TolC, partial [Burkholderiales bacterium]|nr:channel protein TolC [Burkholderiales bacterium]
MRGALLVASALLVAPAAPAADLMGLYREAQVQDAQYAGAKAQYIGTQERLPQGRALLLPNA